MSLDRIKSHIGEDSCNFLDGRPFIGVGQGWHQILIDLNDKLEDISPNYRIDQIKEKFGTLQFYATFVPIERCPLLDFNIDAKAFRVAINDAEFESHSTCEDCGSSGSRKVSEQEDNGWQRTLCKPCRDKERERKEKFANKV